LSLVLTIDWETTVEPFVIYSDVVGRFWPPERSFVESAYQTLPFPLEEVHAPAFTLITDWDLEQVLGYFGSWSAVQRFRDATGTDPLPSLRRALEPHWSAPLRLTWPLHLRVGRISSAL